MEEKDLRGKGGVLTMETGNKRLFGKDSRYTQEGSNLSIEIGRALKPIFEQWLENGYCIRDISHITMSEALVLESRLVLTEAVKRRKTEE